MNFWLPAVFVSVGMTIEALLFVDVLGLGRLVGSATATTLFLILWAFTSAFEIQVKRRLQNLNSAKQEGE